jgi:scyllo-inositol 2-dehydrogenase (NADP+)
MKKTDRGTAARVLRVGILGQGRSGYDIHLRWLREVPDQYKVVAVADQLADRRSAKTELGAKTFRDYRDLLADRSLDLDLVVNALPSFLHSPGTVDALNAGYNVVSEKPHGRTVRDFDAMVEAARQNRRRFFPFQNSRFYPYFIKMREVIASGKLGKIVFIRSNWSSFGRRWDWQAIQEYHGGNLLNTGPHPMDHAVMLFGEKAPKVFARLASENPFGDADNFANVILHGPGAPTIEVVVSSFQAYPQGDQYNVSGTCGGLAGGASGLKWKYFDPKKAPKHKFRGTWSDKRSYCREDLPWVEETWTPPADPVGGFQVLSRGFYNNVYDVLERGADPIITHAQVRRQIAIMEEAHRQNPLPTLKQRFLKRGQA